MQEWDDDVRRVGDGLEHGEDLLAVEEDGARVVCESDVEELLWMLAAASFAILCESMLTSSWSPCVILLSGCPSSASRLNVSAYGQSLHAILVKYCSRVATSTTASIFRAHFSASASCALQLEKSKSSCAPAGAAADKSSATNDSPRMRIWGRLGVWEWRREG